MGPVDSDPFSQDDPSTQHRARPGRNLPCARHGLKPSAEAGRDTWPQLGKFSDRPYQLRYTGSTGMRKKPCPLEGCCTAHPQARSNPSEPTWLIWKLAETRAQVRLRKKKYVKGFAKCLLSCHLIQTPAHAKRLRHLQEPRVWGSRHGPGPHISPAHPLIGPARHNSV